MRRLAQRKDFHIIRERRLKLGKIVKILRTLKEKDCLEKDNQSFIHSWMGEKKGRTEKSVDKGNKGEEMGGGVNQVKRLAKNRQLQKYLVYCTPLK